MTWIYRVDQGRHLPKQNVGQSPLRSNGIRPLPFQQPREAVEGGVGPVEGV